MKTFVGVPILLRGVAYGNLYLTEKAGGEEFTEEDEELTLLLAAQAAVAIENARLYESATRWCRQLASLTEIGNAVSRELELPRLLELVTRRLRGLIDARLVAIALRSADGVRVEAAAGEDAGTVVGIDLSGFKVARVLDRQRSERIDRAHDDPEIDQGVARRTGARAGLFVPLLVRDEAIGVVLGLDRQGRDPRFTDEDPRVAEGFAARAAVAVELSQRVASDAVRRVIEAQELEHETALYRIVQEALTNVVTHAGATHVGVVLTRKGGAVAAVVEDDGRGFDTRAPRADGLGLLGMRERVALVGGSLSVESVSGGGTTIVAQVPLA
jgi:GAF domain-containing protein